MATVINNPGNGNSDSSGGVMGVVIGLIILIVVGTLFFIYVLPTIQNKGTSEKGSSIDVNVKLPTDTANYTPPAGN